MDSFLFVEPDLIYIAKLAKDKIENRFNINNAHVEQIFDSSINYKPTFHWKTKTHIIICDIASSPFPLSIKDFYSDIAVKGIPVKVIIAYPGNRQKDVAKYREEIKKAKEYGIGLLAIDDNENIILENLGVSIPLHISQLDYSLYDKKMRALIEESYESYMINGKPKDGLQKLGQLVESIIINLAVQAKRKGKFIFSGFVPGTYIPQGKLIENLMKENVIDIGILGNCKTFAHERNSVSHAAKNQREVIKIEKQLKVNFQFGLRILEALPKAIKDKRYSLKI